jgi:hypothetical protein
MVRLFLKPKLKNVVKEVPPVLVLQVVELVSLREMELGGIGKVVN